MNGRGKVGWEGSKDPSFTCSFFLFLLPFSYLVRFVSEMKLRETSSRSGNTSGSKSTTRLGQCKVRIF